MRLIQRLHRALRSVFIGRELAEVRLKQSEKALPRRREDRPGEGFLSDILACSQSDILTYRQSDIFSLAAESDILAFCQSCGQNQNFSLREK